MLQENLSMKLFSLVSLLQDPVWPADNCCTWYSHVQVNRKASSAFQDTIKGKSLCAWVLSIVTVGALTTTRLWLGTRRTWGMCYRCHHYGTCALQAAQDPPIRVNWCSVYKIHFHLLLDPASFNVINWMVFVLRFVPLESVTSGMFQKSGPAVFKGKKKDLKIKHIGIKQSYVGKSFLWTAVTPLYAGQ